MPRVLYQKKNLRQSVDSWYKKRKKCFMYHYHLVNGGKLPEDWINLNTISGCRFHGWVQLGHLHRGELWSYATARHRTLITMRVPANRLLWPEQYRKVSRSMLHQQKQWKNQIDRLCKTYGDKSDLWV